MSAKYIIVLPCPRTIRWTPLQIVEIDLLRASPLLAQGGAPPSGAKADFVEPDHRLPAAEVGKELVQQLRNELQRPGIGGAEVVLDGHSRHVFRQVLVAGPVKPALHVAESVLVRHELHEAFAAVLVQLEDLLPGQRRVVPPHLGVIAIREGVLGVELKLVDLEVGEPVDEQLQTLHGGNAPAADVELHPPVCEVGPVANGQEREAAAAAVLAGDLQQRLGAVEEAGFVMSDQADAVLQDREHVPLLLAGPALVHRERAGGGGAPSGGEPVPFPGDQLQSLADRPPRPQEAIPVSRPQLDPAVAPGDPGEVEISPRSGQFSGRRQQDEVARHSGRTGRTQNRGESRRTHPCPIADVEEITASTSSA